MFRIKLHRKKRHWTKRHVNNKQKTRLRYRAFVNNIECNQLDLLFFEVYLPTSGVMINVWDATLTLRHRTRDVSVTRP